MPRVLEKRIIRRLKAAIELPGFREKVEAVFGVVCVSVVVFWAAYSSFIAPARRDETALYAQECETIQKLAVLAFGELDMRLEKREGANVRLYIDRSTFENVPFPDRQIVVEALGEQWCSSVSGTFLPALTIHDIRDGRQLARYGCTWYNVREQLRDKKR